MMMTMTTMIRKENRARYKKEIQNTDANVCIFYFDTISKFP